VDVLSAQRVEGGEHLVGGHLQDLGEHGGGSRLLDDEQDRFQALARAGLRHG